MGRRKVQDTPEDFVANDVSEPCSDETQNTRTNKAQSEVAQNKDQHTDHDIGQGRIVIKERHLIVDGHDEQGQCQGQHAEQKGYEKSLPKRLGKPVNDFSEPICLFAMQGMSSRINLREKEGCSLTRIRFYSLV